MKILNTVQKSDDNEEMKSRMNTILILFVQLKLILPDLVVFNFLKTTKIQNELTIFHRTAECLPQENSHLKGDIEKRNCFSNQSEGTEHA